MIPHNFSLKILVLFFLILSSYVVIDAYAVGLISAPTLTATKQTDSAAIDLSWTTPTTLNGHTITGYKIQRSTDDVTYSVLVADTGSTGTTYTDSSLSLNQIYYYKVQALDEADVAGTESNSASATTNNVPSQVTGLTATKQTNVLTIDLSWTAPSNGGSTITGYQIERSLDNSSWSDLVANTGTTSTTYSDTGLSQGTIYYYRISAINALGTGSASDVASDTTNSAPSAPTLNTVTEQLGAQLILSWTTPANGGSTITGYQIERSSGSGFSVIVADTGTTSTTYSDEGLERNVAYTYRISALNAIGTSSVSNEILSEETSKKGKGGHTTPHRIIKFIETSVHPYNVISINDVAISVEIKRSVDNYATIEVGEKASLQFTLQNDEGGDNAEIIELYVEDAKTGLLSKSDTYLTWKKDTGIEMIDPSGLFKHVSVSISPSESAIDYVYTIEFASTLEKSDIMFKVYDEDLRHVETLTIPDALKVIPMKKEPLAATTLKPIASMWSSGIISDVKFVSTLEKMIATGELEIENIERFRAEETAEFFSSFEFIPAVHVTKYEQNYQKIMGSISNEYFLRSQLLYIDVIDSDGFKETLRIAVNRDMNFSVLYPLEHGDPSGSYEMISHYVGMKSTPSEFYLYKDGEQSFVEEVEQEFDIPEWVYEDAKSWGSDEISYWEFIKAVEFLIKQGVVQV